MKFQGCTWHRPFGSPWSPWDTAQGVSFRSRRWRAGFGGQRSPGELGPRPTGAGMGWNGGGNFFFFGGKPWATHTFRCEKMVKTWFPAKLPWTQFGLVMMDLNLHTFFVFGGGRDKTKPHDPPKWVAEHGSDDKMPCNQIESLAEKNKTGISCDQPYPKS